MSKLALKNIEICKRDELLFIRGLSELKTMLLEKVTRSVMNLSAEVTIRVLKSLEKYEFIPNISSTN